MSEIEYEILHEEGGECRVRCKICEIFCNSLDQFSNHKITSKHIKKAKNLALLKNNHQLPNIEQSSSPNTVDLPPLMVKCEICNTKYNTTIELNTHYSDPSHKIECGLLQTNIEIQPLLVNKIDCNDCRSLSLSPTTSKEVRLLPLKGNDEPVNKLLLQDLLTPERSPIKIPCKLCDQSMDTQEEYLIHCIGTKHQQKMKKILIDDGDMESCEICNIRIHKNNMESHLKGEKHNKKMGIQKTGDATLGQLSSPNNNDYNECLSKLESFTIKEEIQKPSCTKINETVSKDSSIEIIDVLTPERSLNSIKCKLCNQSMNTEAQYGIHCNGKRHKQKTKIASIAGIKGAVEIKDIGFKNQNMEYCKTCDITIQSNNMESHLKGKEHKKKVSKVKDLDLILENNNEFSNCNTEQFLPINECQHPNDIKLEVSTITSIESIALNYKKEFFLGKGSFGKVYKCFDSQSEQHFAVKEVSISPADTSEINAIENEIKIYQKLQSHPNIVKYLGYRQITETMCIFMEFMSGGSIKDKLDKDGPLPVNIIVRYVEKILQGLSSLHEQGILHRDIKGANILLDKDDNVKLCDFGISKHLQTITNNHTNMTNNRAMANTFCGSINWTAPEVINGEEYSFPVDIWSLGATIIEMLTDHQCPRGYSADVLCLYLVRSLSCSWEVSSLLILSNSTKFHLFDDSFDSSSSQIAKP